MAPIENTTQRASTGCRRRRFLRGVGTVGTAGVLAGCLGDESGDENGENGDGEPATFEVSELDPETATVVQDRSVDVTATIENVGDEEGSQNVVLRIDDDTIDFTECTLGGGESEGLSFVLEVAELEGGEYEHAVATDDDEAAGTLTVEGGIEAMTYNVRYDNQGDEYPWDARREEVVALVEEVDPDVLGIQEALPHVVEHLEEDLPQYEWYAVPRSEGGEAVPVGWRSDRYEAIETDTFWLSETPDEQSVGWDASLPRVVSWAELEDASTGNRFWFANAHFDHQGEEARLESARLLRERAQERIDDGQRCIVLGDFNNPPGDDPYEEMISTDLVDSREVAAEVEGPVGTHLGDAFLNNPDEEEADPDPDRRIDHVYVPDAAPVERYRTIPEDLEEGYRSDHLPVTVRIDSYSLEE